MALRFDPYTRDRTGPQAGLRALDEYIRGRWPGTEFLGIFAARNVRGGTTRSLHAEGRALDLRLPSRQALDELIGFVIANADRLNVQALNDYERQMRWRCDRGWTHGGIGHGAPGPTTHIERNWDGALDGRPIADLVSTHQVPKGAPVKVTASCAVPWLPAVNGRLPIVRAELQPDGTTKIVGYQCKIEGGRIGYGVSVRDLGRLAAPITTLTVDPDRKRVIGVADDLGTFALAVAA